MEVKKFQRTTEDFTCGHCGQQVHGNGYTNHCPACLWSQHVDVNPGDRQAACQGMMEPVAISTKAGTHTITHRCTVCGAEKRNKVTKEDDFEVVIKLCADSPRR